MDSPNVGNLSSQEESELLVALPSVHEAKPKVARLNIKTGGVKGRKMSNSKRITGGVPVPNRLTTLANDQSWRLQTNKEDLERLRMLKVLKKPRVYVNG